MSRAVAPIIVPVLLLAASLARAQPAPTAESASAARVEVQMRDTGYVLGDRIGQGLRIVLPPGGELRRETLPVPGPVQHWLELTRIEVSGRGRRIDLQLDYQIFAAVENALTLAVPSLTLRYVVDGVERTLTVPEQPFQLSPVLPPQLDDQQHRARPSPPPQPRSTMRSASLALSALLLAALLAAALAWHADRLPWLSRHPGPLTRLHRRLRRLPLEGAQAYRDGLALFHQGFSSCAGQTLYRQDLDPLFRRARYLLPLESEIRAFFDHAHEVFYRRQPPSPWPAERLQRLARQAMAQERGPGRLRAGRTDR